jgi:hypothetical protein
MNFENKVSTVPPVLTPDELALLRGMKSFGMGGIVPGEMKRLEDLRLVDYVGGIYQITRAGIDRLWDEEVSEYDFDETAFDPIDAPEMMSTELDPSEIETPDPCPKCGAPLSYYSMVRFIECTNRTCDYNSHNQEKSISTAPQMMHEQIKAHNGDALFNGHPQDFIGYDDDTGIGETVSETLERAEACITLIELAIKKQVTYGDLTSAYIEKQCADLRLILGTL